MARTGWHGDCLDTGPDEAVFRRLAGEAGMGSVGIADTVATGAEGRLLALARELSALRCEGPAQSEAIERMAAGLLELSRLAADCRRTRVSNACKALSAILLRLGKGQEDDMGFILSTTLNFLDALQARRIGWGGDRP